MKSSISNLTTAAILLQSNTEKHSIWCLTGPTSLFNRPTSLEFIQVMPGDLKRCSRFLYRLAALPADEQTASITTALQSVLTNTRVGKNHDLKNLKNQDFLI